MLRTPVINVSRVIRVRECACCGEANSTVVYLSFGWKTGSTLHGATVIALCSGCRLQTLQCLQGEEGL